MNYVTDPGTRVGHVHLKVADLDRAVDFYSRIMGFEVQQKFGNSAAFLSAGGYHHHIGLNTWESRGASPAPAGHTGLYHTAFLYPTRRALAVALRQVISEGVKLDGAADHGVSEALYFHDPDGNGIEIYWDRNPQDWPKDENGDLKMTNAPLDIPGLLALVDS